MSVIETKAQEYARTVKTLWQMVEDENLAYRLADASPAEREWLIFNHKNANFPLQPGVIPHHEARSMGAEHARESRQRLHVARPDPKLAPIEEARRTLESTAEEPEDEDETAANSLFPHRQSYQLPKINFHGQIHAAHASVPHALHHHHHRRSPLDSNSDNVMPPQPHMMMSLPNSPTVSAVDSSSSGVSRHSRRSTLLSPMVLQSAKELQKRDHFTIQQRVDMEEDWRMQARLLRGVEECEERARGVAHVQFQLLQRQKQQYLQQQIHEMPREEYQPTHQDFNRWYDLKQEIDDDDDAVLDLLNDDVRGLDLKEEFEDEDEKLQRELLEKEETKRQELDELEHELNILGIDRFDGLCASVAEQQQQRQPEGGQEGALCGSEQIEGYRQKQLVLQQQLQHQYQQLQLQLQLQRHALRSKKILRRKQALLAAAAAVAKNEAFPGPVPMTMAPPSGPCPSAPMTGTGSATTTPLTSPSYGPVKMTVVPAKMILHEPRPLRPRNGRKLFGSEACCDSMIIKDHDISEAMMAAAAAAAPPPLTVPPIPPRMF
ncbi:hypothetical protein EDD11_006922 [Mortierella claussenii]|nr:hypothetical protein EDD11_006922 [Mortierella claussenii]